jgi:hypothetical protein
MLTDCPKHGTESTNIRVGKLDPEPMMFGELE